MLEGVTNDVLLLLNSLIQHPGAKETHDYNQGKKKKNDTSLLNTLGFHTFLLQDSEVTHSFAQPIVYENIALSRVPASVSKKKKKGD